MKPIFLSFILIVLPLTLWAQDERPGNYKLTLEQCLEYAFGNSYTRQSMKLTEEARQDSYNQSKLERLPDLKGSVSESFSHNKETDESWNGSYSVSTSIPLYSGGSINHTIEKNKLQAEQSKYQTRQYDVNLTIQILQAFLNVLGNEELLKYQESLLVSSEAQLKQGEAQYKAGAILESDYLLLEAQYAATQSNIVDIRVNRNNSLLSLKNLLSMDPLSSLQIIYPDTTSFDELAILPPQNEVIARSITSLPDIKISQYNVEIANQNVKLAKSGYFPTLSLSGSLGTGHSKNFDNYGDQLNNKFQQQAGLSLSIPIFSNNRTRSQVTQSKIAGRQALLDQKQTESEVQQMIVQEYQNVISYYEKYKASDITQKAYEKTYNAYRSRFNLGAITAVDLLQQQNNYVNALNNYIQNKYGFLLNRKMLDVYMGAPITI